MQAYSGRVQFQTVVALVLSFIWAVGAQAQVCSTAPAPLQASPSCVDFGELEQAQSSTQTITITNITSSPVFVLGVDYEPHTFLGGTQGDCIQALDPGASCSFDVSFQPTAAGTFSSNVSVKTIDNPPLSVEMTGIGLPTIEDLVTTLPNGGESVIYSTPFYRYSTVLNWSYNDTATQQRTKLSYSTDGSTWTCIADSGDTDCSDGCCNSNTAGTDILAADDETFLWTMPNESEAVAAGQTFPSSSALVRVEVENGGAGPVIDDSDAAFHLISSGDAILSDTLILWNSERMEAEYGAAARVSLEAKLQDLAEASYVDGLVRDVSLSPNVRIAYDSWDASSNQNVESANGVAVAVRRYALEQFEILDDAKYLIIVGDDYQIPFFRVFDSTPSSRESVYGMSGYIDATSSVGSSLYDGYYLSDNFYSAKSPSLSTTGNSYFMNEIFVGRLVQTPQQIEGVITNYELQYGDRYLGSALVVGDDFLYDSGHAMKEAFLDANKPTDCLLNENDNTTPVACSQSGTNQEFDPADVVSSLFAGSPDVATINGHALHIGFGTQAANPAGQDVVCTDPSYSGLDCNPDGLINAAGDLSGSVIYSPGCHSGLVVPQSDPWFLDIPEAMVERGVVAYIGNTGYGWGLISGIGLSESLMVNLTDEFLSSSSISVGEALAAAKNRYYVESGYDVYDKKVLHELTLYGIPNYRVTGGNASKSTKPRLKLDPNGPSRQCVDGVCVEQEALNGFDKSFYGVTQLGLGVSFGPGVYQQVTTQYGDYFTLHGISSGESGKALQPRLIYDSWLSGTQPHGVIFDGGNYSLVSPVDPVVAIPRTTEDDVFLENLLSDRQALQPEMGDLCDSYLTRLVTDTGYHTNADTQTLFDYLHMKIYYSNSNDRTGPTITDPGLGGFHTVTAGSAEFEVEVNDANGIGAVFVTYDQPSEQQWETLELVYNGASDTWQGSLALTELTYYFVQAVDSRGNVTVWTRTYEDPHGVTRTEPRIYPVGTIDQLLTVIAISDTFEHLSENQWLHNTLPEIGNGPWEAHHSFRGRDEDFLTLFRPRTNQAAGVPFDPAQYGADTMLVEADIYPSSAGSAGVGFSLSGDGYSWRDGQLVALVSPYGQYWFYADEENLLLASGTIPGFTAGIQHLQVWYDQTANTAGFAVNGNVLHDHIDLSALGFTPTINYAGLHVYDASGANGVFIDDFAVRINAD